MLLLFAPLLGLAPLAAPQPGAVPPGSLADDWLQYNGPASARTAPAGLANEPLEVRWTVPSGAGFSSFVVGGDALYTLELGGDADAPQEVCVARAASSGEVLWSRPLGVPGYDGGGGAGAPDNKGGDGPRSTPSLDAERVFVLDAGLVLHALDRASGEPLWARDLVADHAGRNIRWQNAASPLLVGDLVLVAGGGAGQSFLAFERATGALAWSAGDETMTHATPVAATLHGREMAVFLVQSGLIALDPTDGSELWRQAYDYRTSSAASPVVHEDLVFVSAGYGVGAAVFRVSPRAAEEREGPAFTVENVWRQRNALMNHWSTPVCRNGYLYGMFSFKKYGEGPLQCVELETGLIRWSQEGFGPGNAILVGETIVALSDTGEVVLAEATHESYRERQRIDALTGKCWSSPAFSDGTIYVRSTEQSAALR